MLIPTPGSDKQVPEGPDRFKAVLRVAQGCSAEGSNSRMP